MESAASGPPGVRLTRPLATGHWSGGLWAGVGLLLALAAVYVLGHAASGQLADLVDPQEPLGLTPETRVGLVLVVVSAYTAGAGLAGLGAAARDLGALRALWCSSDAEWDRLVDRLTPGLREMLPVALAGGTIGLAVEHLPWLLGEADGVLTLRPWQPAIMFILFALLGVQTRITMRQSRVFFDAGRHSARMNLLDPSPLAPFARVGLRSAAMWFGGSALASLLFAQAATGWVVALVLTVTIGIGIASMLLPSRGIHLWIRERKRDELARVRAAIERGGASLFSSAGDQADAGQLSSLIAYEARIEAVREWPFDTATLRRFLLFLLMPLASWIGGALVERVVDAALG